LPGLASNPNSPISASQVAEITGINHYAQQLREIKTVARGWGGSSVVEYLSTMIGFNPQHWKKKKTLAREKEKQKL
jgi:hypothetical protein